MMFQSELIQVFSGGVGAFLLIRKLRGDVGQFLLGGVVPAGLNEETKDAKMTSGISHLILGLHAGMTGQELAYRGRVIFVGQVVGVPVHSGGADFSKLWIEQSELLLHALGPAVAGDIAEGSFPFLIKRSDF